MKMEVGRTIVIYEDEKGYAEVLEDIFRLERPSDLTLLYRDAWEAIKDVRGGMNLDLLVTDLGAINSEGSYNASGRSSTQIRNGYDLGLEVKEAKPKVPIITISAFNYMPKFANRRIEKGDMPTLMSAVKHYLG